MKPEHTSSSSAGKSSVALFLATAGLVAGSSAGLLPAESRELHDPSPRAALLAQATSDCVPVGEGENCARPRRRKKKTTEPAGTPNTPAADTSAPATTVGPESGTPKEVLNDIERGDF